MLGSAPVGPSRGGGAATLALHLALALAAVGCTRANPAYCDSDHPCVAGWACSAASNACVEDTQCAGVGACVCGAPADCPATAADCVDYACQPCADGSAGDAICLERDPAAPIPA